MSERGSGECADDRLTSKVTTLDDSSSYFTNDAIEMDRDRLYFICLPKECTPPRAAAGELQRGGGAVTFCGTEEYVYKQFFADFGPLHVGHVHGFCQKLGRLLQQPQQQEKGCHEEKRSDSERMKPVYVYSSDHPHRRTNAALLVLAYAVLCQGKTAEVAYAPFFELRPPLAPYRDASFAVCAYHLEVLDCVRALSRAASLRHLDLATFDPEMYVFYNKIENGDLNWIIPGKFVAFSGPLRSRREVGPGKWTLLAEDYVPTFRKLGVTCVIRFNKEKRSYDRRRFIERGVKHFDLFYVDGGNPPEEIFQRFLRVCEGTKGAIAVHCKAGLGRTGTNIALYMMKHYGYTAAESIALCRLCRPGSIVGPQQQFLHDLEQRMKREGEIFRRRHHGGSSSAVEGVTMTTGAGGNVVSPQQQIMHDLEQRMRGEGGVFRRRHHKGGGTVAGAAMAGGVGGSPRYDAGRIEPPSTLFASVRRPQKPPTRAHAGSPGGGARLISGSKPTGTSTIPARRHSTTGSEESSGSVNGGNSGCLRSTTGHREASSRSGKRWVWGLNPRTVGRGRGSFNGGGARGSGVSGAAYDRSIVGESSGGQVSRQLPRRASSPAATTHGRGDGVVVNDLVNKLRLSEEGGFHGTGLIEGEPCSDPAAMTGGSRAAPQGKLVPLAISLARPSTTRPGDNATLCRAPDGSAHSGQLHLDKGEGHY